MPVHYNDGTLLTIKPHEENNCPDWPELQFQTAENGTVSIENNTSKPILLGSEIKLCKIISTSDVPPIDDEYYKFDNHLSSIQVKISGTENIKLISQNENVSLESNKIIEQVHSKFTSVFIRISLMATMVSMVVTNAILTGPHQKDSLLIKSKFPVMIIV